MSFWTVLWLKNNDFEIFVLRFFHFHFFQTLGGLPSCSPELRSTESRNESFWDGLGPEIDGVHPRFFALAQYSASRNIPSDHSILPQIDSTWNHCVDPQWTPDVVVALRKWVSSQ